MRYWMLVWCALTLACAPAARGDIIIDDFTDTASAGGALVDRESLAVTLDVGPLAVKRTIGVHVLAGDVVGTIDSNVSMPGHLTANMVDVISNPPPTNGPIAWMDVRYQFQQPTNLSENGQNNALILDFKSLTGLTPPPDILFWVTDNSGPLGSYVYFLRPVPASPGPFSVMIPFTALRDRGAGTLWPNFDDVTGLDIYINANERQGAPEELGWNLILDRIRVGVVPEPCSGLLLGTGVMALLARWSNRALVA